MRRCPLVSAPDLAGGMVLEHAVGVKGGERAFEIMGVLRRQMANDQVGCLLVHGVSPCGERRRGSVLYHSTDIIIRALIRSNPLEDLPAPARPRRGETWQRRLSDLSAAAGQRCRQAVHGTRTRGSRGDTAAVLRAHHAHGLR